MIWTRWNREMFADMSAPLLGIIAVGDVYYMYQHAKIGVFRVVQKLQELFRAGTVRPPAAPVRMHYISLIDVRSYATRNATAWQPTAASLIIVTLRCPQASVRTPIFTSCSRTSFIRSHCSGATSAFLM